MLKFNLREEAILPITKSFGEYTNHLEGVVLSDAIIGLLSHIQKYDSIHGSNNYVVILGTINELYLRAQQKFTIWLQSVDSFSGYAEAMKAGSQAVNKMSEVCVKLANSFTNCGDVLDDLVFNYVNMNTKLPTLSRTVVLSNLHTAKSTIYSHRSDYLNSVKRSSNDENIMWNCILTPIDIIYEYFIHSLAAITAIVQSANMPDIYTCEDELTNIRTAVFAIEQDTSTQFDRLIELLTRNKENINSLSAEKFAILSQKIETCLKDCSNSTLADMFK